MATTRLDNLYKWMAYVGLEVHTVAGWSGRGVAFWPTVSLTHWTGGPAGAKPGTRPTLRLVTEGRDDLPGPLCQDYLGRAGEVVLVASGRANHAGPGLWMGVTGNTGSTGTEAECAGPNDWTAAQRKSYPLIHVAKLFAMWEKGTIGWTQITEDRVCSHAEFALPKGRKVDVNGYHMSTLRAQVAALIPGFKARVNGKPIAVGTPAVYDWSAGNFVDQINHVPAPTPTPAPTPEPPKEAPLSAEEVRQINAHTTAQIDRLIAAVGNIPGAVWDAPLKYRDYSRGTDRDVPAREHAHYLSWGNANAQAALDALTGKNAPAVDTAKQEG
jgi:hypothetical protein